MFVWSSSASPVSEVSGLPDFTGGAGGGVNVGAKEIRMVIPAELPPQNGSAGKGTSAHRAARARQH
jgi:auxin efflux carrier family